MTYVDEHKRVENKPELKINHKKYKQSKIEGVYRKR
jgi:hypothetical protein